jgi:hypothetical protein
MFFFVAVCHSFCLVFLYMQSLHHTKQNIRPSQFPEVHLLIANKLNGKKLPCGAEPVV